MPLTPDELRAYKRAWLDAHPGYNAAYHQANKQRIKSLHKKWCKANQERNRARKSAWAKNNPEKAAFYRHRGQAKIRGIPFLLTFEEWLTIWRDSGKWEQRGQGRGQYVMARFADQGPYAVGNVRICTSGENHAEYRARLRHP